VAIDVPLRRKYDRPTVHDLHSDVKVLLGASAATSFVPGASTSGFAKPSWVTPRLDHDGTLSS
jgi:hypothetical protein